YITVYDVVVLFRTATVHSKRYVAYASIVSVKLEIKRCVDEQTIIDILTKRSCTQRSEIAFEYEKWAKKDLVSALKGALSGSLNLQYDASELKSSMKICRGGLTH
uniref:Uncharacterized protein n=1 Tax=Sinocyclocheilus anshuiensis TaxID=1608454 RepID=A0A671NPX1_9TELE